MIQGGIIGSYYGDGAGNSKNPVSYYFGKDQTERAGENYTPGGIGNQRAAEFKATADETYDGGKADLLTITNASDESTIDMTNGPDTCLIQFPKGRYHLLFQGYTAAQYQTTFRIELKQIQTGTDDLAESGEMARLRLAIGNRFWLCQNLATFRIITHTPGYAGGSSPARTTYQLIWSDLVVDGTEKFYFPFPTGGASHRSHFLRIEKVA